MYQKEMCKTNSNVNIANNAISQFSVFATEIKPFLWIIYTMQKISRINRNDEKKVHGQCGY